MRKTLLVLALGVAFATPAIAKDSYSTWSGMTAQEKERYAAIALHVLLTKLDDADPKSAGRIRVCAQGLKAEDLAMLVDVGYANKSNLGYEPAAALAYGFGVLVQESQKVGGVCK